MTRAWTCVLFAAAGAVAMWQSSRATVLWDVTYVLEIAHRIRLGDVPYRDIAMPQPPFTFLMQAALSAAGGGYVAVRIYCAIAAGLTAALTYRIVLALVPPSLRARATIAAGIVLPCVCLNGFVILPLPFYDSDCALLALAALAAVLNARRHIDALWRSGVAGAAIVLPIVAKQNMGLAFAVAAHVFLLASAARSREPRERRAYGAVLAGSLAAAVFLASAIHAWIGLGNYYEWTVAYAASRRWPSPRLVLQPYLRLDTWAAAALAALGYLLFRSSAAAWRMPVGGAIAVAPFAYAGRTMLRWGLSARSHYLWGLGTLAGGALALAQWLADRMRFEPAAPLVALAIAHAAFASQGVYDSAYSVWPFLAIAIVPIVSRVHASAGGTRAAAALVAAVALGGGSIGLLHVARQERLGFVDLSGPVHVASAAPIRGMAVPGSHMLDFERLLERTNALIPRTSGVLAFPGEDPFFLASGRKPRLPVVLFDDTAMPYDGARLMELLDRHLIEWVVVKTPLQLRRLPWRHMESFLSEELPRRFAPVESVPGYIIFRRRTPAPAIVRAR